jgi:Asp-tRNA(Asn)/Glu-tRNA(Gln) amidotransferase A subunit family amidase
VAREHPAAVVRRRQAEDAARLAPTIRHLTERQYELFFLFQSVITRHRPDGLARLVDADVADAAAALAATLETASRGVIYEHRAQSHPAQSLAAAMKALLEEIRKQGAKVYDGEAAIALRAIEQGARTLRAPHESDAVYLELARRMLQVDATETPQPAVSSSGSLILP